MSAVKRDFAFFLDEAESAAAGIEADTDAPVSPPSIPFGIVGDAEHGISFAVTPDSAAAAYFDVAARLIFNEHLPDVTPDAIARELALECVSTPKELDRLRRDFAFRNHPDRVRLEWHEYAVIRMQIANRLIDEAKSRASE